MALYINGTNIVDGATIGMDSNTIETIICNGSTVWKYKGPVVGPYSFATTQSLADFGTVTNNYGSIKVDAEGVYPEYVANNSGNWAPMKITKNLSNILVNDFEIIVDAYMTDYTNALGYIYTTLYGSEGEQIVSIQIGDWWAAYGEYVTLVYINSGQCVYNSGRPNVPYDGKFVLRRIGSTLTCTRNGTQIVNSTLSGTKCVSKLEVEFAKYSTYPLTKCRLKSLEFNKI